MIINPYRFTSGAPFTNTKSLLFDGMDDYVDCGNDSSINISGDLTLSAWVFIPLSSNTFYGVFSKIDASTRNYELLIRNNETISFYTSNTEFTTSTSAIPLNTWTHVLVTVNSGATGGVKFYFNGVLDATTGTQTVVAQTHNLSIGRRSTGSFYLNGNIDEPCIFDRVVTPAEIVTLSTAPTVDLTSLNPVLWLRNGDNGAWKSPQWLIPNNENKDKVSNYSFELDGVGDKVSIGTALDLGINSTLSFWIKRGRISTSEVWFGEDSYSSDYLVTITATDVLYFRIDTAYVGWDYPTVKSIFNSTTDWVNVVIVRSGDSIELFLNGISYGTGNSNFGTPGSTVTRFDTIGATPYGIHTFAQFDEIVAWNNNTVNPLDIYNGGTPTTISGAVVHYKMGEEANFTSNWLVDNSALDNYSKRSFAFDGMDDYVSTGLNLGYTNYPNISLSCWVKMDNASLTNYTVYNPIGVYVTAYTNSSPIALYRSTVLGGTKVHIQGVASSYGTTNLSDGAWHHIVQTCQYDAAGTICNIYVDGNPTPEIANALFRDYSPLTSNLNIGSSTTTIRSFLGNVDEVSVFDSILSTSDIADIYNGGEPTTISGAIAHYRMGEDATFSGGVWTVPDEVGSNDGTSANMDISDLVGEAPNYSGGGISANMTIEDRVGDAPNSENNALSFNMDEVDRVNDTP